MSEAPYPVDPVKEAERKRKLAEYEENLRREAAERLEKERRALLIQKAQEEARRREAQKKFPTSEE